MNTDDKSQKRVSGMFDRIAPTYDMLNHILSLSIDKRWRARAIKEMEIAENDLILDLASGTGDMGLAALELCPACYVVGLDISQNMLHLAQEKAVRNGLDGRFGFIFGDACGLPFQEGTFDKAMVTFGIRNMPDVSLAFAQVKRVLKNGGTLAILEFSMPQKPVIRTLYSWYFKSVLPFVGGLISGDGEAYHYLPGSINEFLSPSEVESAIEDSGFSMLKSIRLFPGISHLYIAVKKTDTGKTH